MTLYGIYVFHENGQLMFSKDFPHEQSDGFIKRNPNLISGLMAALGTFTHSIGGGGIHNIQMDNFAICGIVSPTYCTHFLAICSIGDSQIQIRALLKKVRASFTRKYAKTLKLINKGELVNTDHFSAWSGNLDNILRDFEFDNIETIMTSTLKDIASFFKNTVKKLK